MNDLGFIEPHPVYIDIAYIIKITNHICKKKNNEDYVVGLIYSDKQNKKLNGFISNKNIFLLDNYDLHHCCYDIDKYFIIDIKELLPDWVEKSINTELFNINKNGIISSNPRRLYDKKYFKFLINEKGYILRDPEVIPMNTNTKEYFKRVTYDGIVNII